MNREEAIEFANEWLKTIDENEKDSLTYGFLTYVIYELQQKPCGNVINKEDALKVINKYGTDILRIEAIKALPPVSTEKARHCKNCKWWKDSDGLYRRGAHAESKCPINRKEVLEGNGYCYMFEAKMESEERNDNRRSKNTCKKYNK